MQTLIGFAVGYYLGTQHGREGLRRVLEAWDALRRSEEVRGLVSTALSVGAQALAARGGVLSQALAGMVAGRAREVITRRLLRAA
jgi:hypothetical protein